MIPVLIIDIQGGEKVHKYTKDHPDYECNYIFIELDLKQIEQRLRARKTESEEKIQKRLKTAEKEMQMLDELKHIY